MERSRDIPMMVAPDFHLMVLFDGEILHAAPTYVGILTAKVTHILRQLKWAEVHFKIGRLIHPESIILSNYPHEVSKD